MAVTGKWRLTGQKWPSKIDQKWLKRVKIWVICPIKRPIENDWGKRPIKIDRKKSFKVPVKNDSKWLVLNDRSTNMTKPVLAGIKFLDFQPSKMKYVLPITWTVDYSVGRFEIICTRDNTFSSISKECLIRWFCRT